jgi:hypothetical protein
MRLAPARPSSTRDIVETAGESSAQRPEVSLRWPSRYRASCVFLAWLERWDDVPGGEWLAGQPPWGNCKMETPWADFAFAVDVSDVYERKRQALAAYTLIFQPEGDRLLALYEAEDQYFGRLLGVAYAEIFRSASRRLTGRPFLSLPGHPDRSRRPRLTSIASGLTAAPVLATSGSASSLLTLWTRSARTA